jgi:acid phosphatase family membrane protein YuiD
MACFQFGETFFMRNAVSWLTGNHILNVSILSFATAQVLKVILTLIQYRRFDATRIFGSGGMPSAHSATVCSLTVSVARVNGTTSSLFAVATILAIIVMYDATNVRRAAGDQAKVINYMMEHWNDVSPELFKRNLKELLGHSPMQVFCGAVLGVVMGLFL